MGLEDVVPEEIVREGLKADEITRLIEEDPDIGVLVLGASKDPSGPGPLVTTLPAAGSPAPSRFRSPWCQAASVWKRFGARVRHAAPNAWLAGRSSPCKERDREVNSRVLTGNSRIDLRKESQCASSSSCRRSWFADR